MISAAHEVLAPNQRCHDSQPARKVLVLPPFCFRAIANSGTMRTTLSTSSSRRKSHRWVGTLWILLGGTCWRTTTTTTHAFSSLAIIRSGTACGRGVPTTTTMTRTCAPRRVLVFLANNNNDEDNDSSDPVSRLPLMEAKLASLRLLDRPQDADAASELATQIDDAKTAAELGVRSAQLQFYDAFSRGDLEAMDRVWSTESDQDVRCIHPGMACITGRTAVMESWKSILTSSSSSQSAASSGTSSSSSSSNNPGFTIGPERTQVEIHGLVAICHCVEVTGGGVAGGTLEAVNIYKREGGSWKMTLHMAGPVFM